MKKRVPEGFTVTEMMVAMAVMVVILLVAIVFFRTQSKMSGTATRDRLGRQDITLALTALQRDIVQAGYGLPLYPQLAFMFGDGVNNVPPAVNQTHNNLDTKDPRFGLPVYGTIWISYGQYMKSTIPIIPNSNPAQAYAMWPSLVYNMQPLSNTDMVGGIFSIPAADNWQNYFGPNNPLNNVPEATANANNIGAVIVWPNAPTGLEATRKTSPVNMPGNITKSAVAGTTNAAPPSQMCTQFTVQTPPGGTFWFAPAVVYNFVPSNGEAPGYITRNQDPTKQVNSTFLGDNSLAIIDFQIRALYSSIDGLVQAWMPDSGALPPSLNSSNLRYVEIKIVYCILDPYTADTQTQLADVQAGNINSVTRTMRVSPRTVVLSSY